MQLRCGSRLLDLTRPIVMGVLNVTPDSFSDGGRFVDPSAAFSQAERMVSEGAAILDIGGESTRPGAAAVSTAQEMDRVIPIVQRLASWDVVVSVDTRSPDVMAEAIRAGAGMLNDVTGFKDPRSIEVAARSGAALCVMHMQGEPGTMQIAPRYDDVVTEVKAFLADRVQACVSAGVDRQRIVVDPGFGFGKTLEHNLALLRGLRAIGGGFPVLVGLSRKSMLQALTGRAVCERIHGSVALAVIAVLNGAAIVRAHDVAATVDALRVATAVVERE